MRDFDSVAEYLIQGRRCIGVRLDREEIREGLLQRLQAEGVRIDGVSVEIDGVESFAVSPLRAGMEITLRLADRVTDQR